MSAKKTMSKAQSKFIIGLIVLIALALYSALGGAERLDKINDDTNASDTTYPLPPTSHDYGTQAPNQAFFRLSSQEASVARAELESLPVKPWFEGEYQRGEFGSPWTDTADGVAFAGNGCKTRDDILRRDMSNLVVSADDCVVNSGRLWNPYGTSGNAENDWIEFQRGSGVAVDIDHVVALKNAWRTGAYLLDRKDRVALANDPINLVAVRGSDNRAKGDRDVSEWVPANREIHCGYAASQIQVKAKYHLWVTPSEKDVLGKMLDTCPAGV